MSTVIPFPSLNRGPAEADARLRAQLLALLNELQPRDRPDVTERLDMLTARVERLEAALQPITEPRP